MRTREDVFDLVGFIENCLAHRLILLVGVLLSIVAAILVWGSSVYWTAQVTAIPDHRYVAATTYAALARLSGLETSVSGDVSVDLVQVSRESGEAAAMDLAVKLQILEQKTDAFLPDYQSRVSAAEEEYQTLEQRRLDVLEQAQLSDTALYQIAYLGMAELASLSEKAADNKTLLAEKDRMVYLSDTAVRKVSSSQGALVVICLGAIVTLLLVGLIGSWNRRKQGG